MRTSLYSLYSTSNRLPIRYHLALVPPVKMFCQQNTSCRSEHSQIHEKPPEDRKHQPLQTVSKDPGLQSTPEKSLQAINSNHGTGSIEITDASCIDLTIGLDDSERVGDGIRHDRSAEANEGLSAEFLQCGIRRRKMRLEEIICAKPLQPPYR